jgi:hypothetical protein
VKNLDNSNNNNKNKNWPRDSSTDVLVTAKDNRDYRTRNEEIEISQILTANTTTSSSQQNQEKKEAKLINKTNVQQQPRQQVQQRKEEEDTISKSNQPTIPVISKPKASQSTEIPRLPVEEEKIRKRPLFPAPEEKEQNELPFLPEKKFRSSFLMDEEEETQEDDRRGHEETVNRQQPEQQQRRTGQTGNHHLKSVSFNDENIFLSNTREDHHPLPVVVKEEKASDTLPKQRTSSTGVTKPTFSKTVSRKHEPAEVPSNPLSASNEKQRNGTTATLLSPLVVDQWKQLPLSRPLLFSSSSTHPTLTNTQPQQSQEQSFFFPSSPKNKYSSVVPEIFQDLDQAMTQSFYDIDKNDNNDNLRQAQPQVAQPAVINNANNNSVRTSLLSFSSLLSSTENPGDPFQQLTTTTTKKNVFSNISLLKKNFDMGEPDDSEW